MYSNTLFIAKYVCLSRFEICYLILLISICFKASSMVWIQIEQIRIEQLTFPALRSALQQKTYNYLFHIQIYTQHWFCNQAYTAKFVQNPFLTFICKNLITINFYTHFIKIKINITVKMTMRVWNDPNLKYIKQKIAIMSISYFLEHINLCICLVFLIFVKVQTRSI